MPTLEAAPVNGNIPEVGLGIGPDFVTSYLSFGNVRPSKGHLEEYTARMRIRSPRKMGPYYHLTMADMNLDLAVVDPEQSFWRTQEAGQYLAKVVSLGRETLGAGGSGAIDRVGRSAIVAHWRLGEMTNWRDIVGGEQPKIEYERLLKAAYESYKFFCGANVQTRNKASEFIPILLGARAEARGWAGRLALVREDNGAHQLPGQNRNWDIGVASTMDTDNFLNPTLRVNIKGRKSSDEKLGKENSIRYLNGGVIELVADECGFENPEAVIKGCLFEERISAPDTPGYFVRKFCSAKLDDITERISERLFHTSALAKAA